jgi:hypothetical protein
MSPKNVLAPHPTAEDDANGAGVRRTSSKGDGST